MRNAKISRKTNETDIKVKIALDEFASPKIETGIGFFDHMLTAMAVHSMFDIAISCVGDTNVDDHHTIEDVGICFGKTLKMAIGEKSTIARFGSFTVPMDEAKATVDIDISNRPYLVFNVEFKSSTIGNCSTQMFKEFFYAVCVHAGITLHINVPYGENDHHIAEAIFKAFAHALYIATRESGVLFTSKGVL